MKNYDKLSDNEHKIDLISLDNFLLEKGDSFLNRIIETRTVKKENVTKEFFQEKYLWLFHDTKDRTDFNGEDFPAEWYSENIINDIIRNPFVNKYKNMYLLCLNSNLDIYYSLCDAAVTDNAYYLKYVSENTKNYYSICKKAVNQNASIIRYINEKFVDSWLWELALSTQGYLLQYLPKKYMNYNSCYTAIFNDNFALEFVPKDIKNYYELVKLAFESNSYIVETDWFPKEYILKLIENENYSSGRKEYLTKQYYLKENNNMTKKDILIEFIKNEILKQLNEAKKSKKKVGPTGKKLIKRKDGSYSEEGLWDNIRKNKGSGKKPTPEMKAQEKKIKRAEK